MHQTMWLRLVDGMLSCGKTHIHVHGQRNSQIFRQPSTQAISSDRFVSSRVHRMTVPPEVVDSKITKRV